MVCRFCGQEVDPSDLLHVLTCDGRQGAREASLPDEDEAPAGPLREPPVFDIETGRALRDDAIGRVRQGSPDFQTAALDAIYRAALTHRQFITDQVWALLSLEAIASDNRGMGAAMMTAKRNGWIEPTEDFQQSAMTQNHARPCRVWRSKLRRAQP